MSNLKSLLLVFFFGLISLTVNAQEVNNQSKTLFQNFKPTKNIKTVGLYVAPQFQYANFAGAYTPVVGISGMAQMNKKWGIGLSVFSNYNDFTPAKISATKAYNFDVKYGGLSLEYTLKPDALFHVSFPATIGIANARIDSVETGTKSNEAFGEKNHNKDEFGMNNESENPNYFMYQQGIRLETNIFKYGKVFIGANYRLALGKTIMSTTAMPNVTPSNLSGLSFNIGAKFGIFDFDPNKHSKRKK